MYEFLWVFAERIKKFFWCRFFHRKHFCHPEAWGRGLAGPFHCSLCHPCSEAIDVLLNGQPLIGLLGQLYIKK